MSLPADATATAIPPRRVRTRFAPSPTGFLHVGAVRTALFSWLLARHFGGDFILRIEDTDQTRLVPGSLQGILEAFRAMGMDIDEGPDRETVAALDAEKYGTVDPGLLPARGGSHGPYFQSQRLPRYRELVERLVSEGKAYYAFDTKEELDGMRAAAEAHKRAFLYRGRARDLPLDEARARVAAGEPHVVRFKMPTEGPIRTLDVLRGVTDWDAATQDDFVILKSDGYPPYHLAAIVDDHDMEISHALRSTEWLSSSPKHFCLYQAFGWEPPLYIHVANVNGPDGKKLSKRKGAKPVVGTFVEEGSGKSITGFVDDGFLPDALFNFLALVGWSPGDDSEVMDRDEIIRRFDGSGMLVSPAVFDKEKLTWMNGVYLRRLSREELVTRALPYLVAAGLVPAAPGDAERVYIAEVIGLEHERLKTLAEAPEVSDFFFALLPAYQEKSVARWLRKKPEETAAFLSDLHDVLAKTSVVWETGALETVTREAGMQHGRDKGELTHPVRVALSGREVGPGLFEMMAVLGRERVLARLKHATELARSG